MPQYHDVLSWRQFFRASYARAYPRITFTFRERWWTFFDIFLPLVATFSFVFVYRSIKAPEAFIGFVIVGGAMSAYWLNVMWAMASQLFWEKESGNLPLFIMAPVSLMSVLFGMAIGGMFATTLRALTILAVGSWVFDVHYSVSSYPLLAAVFVLALVALYGMGAMLSSVFLLFGREAWHLVNLTQEPVFLLSGAYFPMRNLNVWLASFACLIPLALALDAMRQLVFPPEEATGFLSVQTEMLMLAGLAIVFLAAARFLLGYMERLAVREGRLTESRG
jgi:ABC-2 type transport system permease protein